MFEIGAEIRREQRPDVLEELWFVSWGARFNTSRASNYRYQFPITNTHNQLSTTKKCKFDGIIVGAGPVGAQRAYHRAKQDVLFWQLEKKRLCFAQPCGGVSGRSPHGKISLTGRLLFSESHQN